MSAFLTLAAGGIAGGIVMFAGTAFSHDADAGSRSAEDAAGYSVSIGGEPIPDSQVGSAVAQQRAYSTNLGLNLSDSDIARFAVTEVALSEALVRYGESLGNPVTEEDITEALSQDTRVVGVEYVGASSQDPSPVSASNAARDPSIREIARRGLYKSRAMSSVLAGPEKNHIAGDEQLATWFTDQLASLEVSASTPFGKVSREEMVASMAGPRRSTPVSTDPPMTSSHTAILSTPENAPRY